MTAHNEWDYGTGLDNSTGSDHIDTFDHTPYNGAGVGFFGRMSPQVWAWSYVVGAILLLWLLGGVMFRRSNG